MKKILFVSHEASRTGAPLVLLYFMQWLKEREPSWEIHVTNLNGGELLNEFENSANTAFQSFGLEEKYLKRYDFIPSRINDKIFHQQTFRRKYMDDHYTEIASGNYDIIYANTILAIPFATEIKKRVSSKTKLIAHIHELECIIQVCLPDLINYVPHIDRFIAASNPVKDNLIANHGVGKESVSVVYEFSKIDNAVIPSHPQKSFIVGGSGTAHWRKGDDLFIQIARYIRTNHAEADIRFQWVGEVPKHQQVINGEDILKAGLNGYIEFTGPTSSPHNFYSNFDVFLMVSREDPFPLVCIETAMLQKPVICFDKGNGTADIIKEGGGSIIPYLNIEAAAAQILFYYHNPDVKLQHGKEAAVLFGKFTPENQCPEIMAVITEMTEQTNSSGN